ncbi:MAG TPA: DUF4367 domain-containing protein [Candidatus Atribacteria bacterium]|nr:DUF4367 domain-containing protein [Candidatus Atribacteria bacterium]
MIIESSSNLKLKRSLELYLEDLILQYPDADAVSAHTFSPRFERKMSALISRRKKPYYYLVNTVGKQVAVVILVILLTLSGTVFSVKALREPVVNFFIEIYETFSKILFSSEDDENYKKIETYYAPQYIPEGFMLKEEDKNDLYYRLIFTDSRSNLIIYSQLSYNKSTATVDTEDVVVEETTMNGLSVIYLTNKGYNRIVLNDGVYVYSITAPKYISHDELFKMGASLMALNNKP